MSGLTYAFSDTFAMLRRDIQHSLRYLPMTLSGILSPVFMLALMVYVFGGSIGSSLGGSYINYVAPAILIMTVGSGCATTALSLCTDMNEGIITRFRTMAISRASVLGGQALGSLLRTLISITLVLGLALLMGFRPTTNPVAWVEALGITAIFTVALTWMALVFGLVGKTPAGANSLALIFQFVLPMTSSAFVRTDSLPGPLRWFAEHQPFTAVIDTLRALLLGSPLGNSAMLAVVWSAVIAIVGYFLARAIYNRSAK